MQELPLAYAVFLCELEKSTPHWADTGQGDGAVMPRKMCLFLLGGDPSLAWLSG